MYKNILLLTLLISLTGCYGDPASINGDIEQPDIFGYQVISYLPAPGQFINNTSYNNPANGLGAPDEKIVTLGGFGGSITILLDRPIIDLPGEVDFVIIGNALYFAGDNHKRWAEPALVEISSNGNDWIIIGGSIFNTAFKPATNLITVNYTNTNSNIWPTWCSSNSFNISSYSINPKFSPRLEGNGNYTNAFTDSYETLYGFGDCTPKGNFPTDFNSSWGNDDPLTFGNANIGGDSIKIEWAINSNGDSIYEKIRYNNFSFVRLTTAVNINFTNLGEMSPELDAIITIR